MKVNWDDDIPNIWENEIDVPNHQPESNYKQPIIVNVIIPLNHCIQKTNHRHAKSSDGSNMFQHSPR